MSARRVMVAWSLSCLWGAFAVTSAAAQVPTSLAVSIGGFPGSSYAVTWRLDHLEYTAFIRGKPVEKRIRPTSEQWNHFWRAVNALELASWNPVYRSETPPGQPPIDGTHWELTLEVGSQHYRSAGRDNYPSDQDPKQGTAGPHPGARFSKFLAAVRELLEGLEFQ